MKFWQEKPKEIISKIEQNKSIIFLTAINLSIVFFMFILVETIGLFSVNEFISLNVFFYILVLFDAFALLLTKEPKTKKYVKYFLFFLFFLLVLQSFEFHNVLLNKVSESLDNLLSHLMYLTTVSIILIFYYSLNNKYCLEYKKDGINKESLSSHRQAKACKKISTRLTNMLFIATLVLLFLALLGFKIRIFSGLHDYGAIIGILAIVFSFYGDEYKKKKKIVNTDFLFFLVFICFILFSLYAVGIPGESPDTIKYMGRGFQYIAEKFGYTGIVEWYSLTTPFDAVKMTGTPGVTSAVTSAIFIIIFEGYFNPVVSSRIGHIMVNAIFLILFYFFIKKIWNNETALYSALLLACNPYFIALSRIPNPDSILVFFVSCALFSFYLLFKKGSAWMIALAVFISLSILTKISAVVLLPVFFIWASLLTIKKDKQNYINNMLRKKKNYLVLFSILIAVILCMLFWPELNGKNSIVSFKETFVNSTTPYMHHPKEANYEIMGVSHKQFPMHYYLVLLFVRLPVIMLILLFAGISYISKDKRFFKDKNLLIIIFLLFSLLFLSLSTKKGDKYHLFIYPCLSIIMAYGLYHLRRCKGKVVFFLAILLIVSAGIVYSPYHFESYNALTNLGKNIYEFYPAGWGDGHKEAANYIIREHGNNKTVLLMGYSSDFRRYYPGRITWRTKANPDIGVFYRLHDSIHPGSKNMRYATKEGTLEKEITINNVDLVKIYSFNS